MSNLNEYLNKRDINDADMIKARKVVSDYVEAYRLKEARKAMNMTQVQLAEAIGVSQNRISRMENGDIETMSIDSLRRYVTALGGTLTLVVDLPDRQVQFV